MTDRDEALAALAELTDQAVHTRRLQLIADALNADPPATWEQIGEVFGKSRQQVWRKYKPDLDVTAPRRTVRVRPNPEETA
ncbi:hypothetical protein [Micromonospora wenchangensis]|uniref:hypothetical protein n=1 Tax=Micromonospora wenchangensis TaxID=1185415 RepID=UPI0037F9E4A8